MATDTPIKTTPATRRHPLEVTADRLEQAAREYPQLWDAVERAAIERVSRKLRIAVEQGFDSSPSASSAPENAGEPYDQRSGRV